MLRSLCKFIAFILGAIVAFSAIFVFALLYLNNAPEDGASVTETVARTDSGEIRMEVRDGESAASIGERLEEARLIKNQYAWHLLCRARPDFLKAGMYQFEAGKTMLELHSLFISGKQVLCSVTIPEGSTIKKTARLFEDAEICSFDDFIEAAHNEKMLNEYNIDAQSAEGYLYPDTYHFTARYPAARVIRTMLDTFLERMSESKIDIKSISPRELRDKITLASIIEGEYRIADEAPVMAGVFLNRLKDGMRLESCATVVYVMTEIQNKPHPSRLFNRDLEVKSPYNTYANKGLPPGPISSPGGTAIRAAFFPLKNDYLFFRIVDPGAGRHYFSRTFDDHIKAGALLVK